MGCVEPLRIRSLMPHTVVLELKLTLTRSGMAEVTEDIIDHEIQGMVERINETFPVDSVERKYTVTRHDP